MVTGSRTSTLLALLAPVALILAPACTTDEKKDDKKEEGKEETKEPAQRDPSTSLDKVAKGPDLSGPVPPEISAVFFGVDGALIPLACYDKDKKQLKANANCLKLIDKSQEVFLKSEFSAEFDTIGEPKDALCEAGGAVKPTSLATSKLDTGQAFDLGVWPKSAAQKLLFVGEDSTGDDARKVDNDEKTALREIVKAEGDIDITQVADLDIDGDGKSERFYSARVVNPKDTARYLFSGLIMRSGADQKLTLIEETKTHLEVFSLRGAIDLDGDGTHELWVKAAFAEGGGERLYELKGGAAKAIGNWSCGL